MKGITLQSDDDKTTLFAYVEPRLLNGSFDIEALSKYAQNQSDVEYYLIPEALMALTDSVNLALSSEIYDTIESIIGETRDAFIDVQVANDEMSAELIVHAPYGGKIPSLFEILDLIDERGIKRGVSEKRINKLLELSAEASGGSIISDVIAKGLTARNGKNSRLKALVPNALDRILAPQPLTGGKVDMRDLGEILCVDPEDKLAKRLPPTKGRKGYTVMNSVLEPAGGVWEAIKLGSNTHISENNENLVLASMAGQAKFVDGMVLVEDAFESKGVNVGTGNIQYKGAVIINGDVKENMVVQACGDITVNGFVESAMIKSDGDIIITQGAMGKMHDVDCRLIAGGNIYLAHAQGLDIECKGDLHVAKELAFSRVKCSGNIIVGTGDKPSGSVFGCEIECCKNLSAGSIGASSGSKLTINYTQGYEEINHKLLSINQIISHLEKANTDHISRLEAVQLKTVPVELREKFKNLSDEVESEKELLTWLTRNRELLREQVDNYAKSIKIVANVELFPGVVSILSNKTWEGQKECRSCQLYIENNNWVYEPLI
ncbi:DUF342 domain-containing protein [Glaciecola petra]|uniref:FapA family protein n=1 Tax=Glaciecola petra TaxID=3075602 RepID=A0ABU2ZNI9_9ALTE|nr:FapA family protein [Aestuariibacter sp. P117]MDT0594192.1 FapA family protein [Aestuariibacter sp. P117]